MQVASAMLHNVHKENKRAKSERSFASLHFLSFYKLSLGFELGLHG